MHHVAIMNPRWKLIAKIVSGEKVIESRWYMTRRAPWNGLKKGDTVFFKDSGKRVTAESRVGKVLQFELASVDDARSIVKKYGKKICIVNKDPASWGTRPKYCILIFLTKARLLKKSFSIDKQGFGSAAAWLTVRHINDIIVP